MKVCGCKTEQGLMQTKHSRSATSPWAVRPKQTGRMVWVYH